MNLVQRERAEETETSMHFHLNTRLYGYWLLAARIIWIVLALAVVVLNTLALPGVPAAIVPPPDLMHELRRLHLSATPGIVVIMTMNGLCMLLYLGVGALLFWRRSDDRMVFFCSLMLLTFGGGVFGFLEYNPPPSFVWNLAFYSLFFLGQVSFLVFFYLFPSGHFVPRWTRWCALLSVAYWVVWLSFQGGIAAGPPGYLFLLFLLTAVIAQVYRYRSVSTRAERQQTKWVVFGFVIGMFLFLVTSLIPLPLLLASVVSASGVYLSFMLIPICIGIAIFRTQLFDIDLIIKRTLVYGALTAFVIGVYVLVVGYLGALFHTGSTLVISLLATGLVAVLFQPLRELLQRGVNRLLYGQRDEPYRVLSLLGQRLEATLVPDAVLSVIVETVAQALKLPYAAITVQQDDASSTTTSYGTVIEPLFHLPLLYQSEQVGELVLAPRSRGESFTPADHRLLEDLARQIGVAVHAMRLTAYLQQSRERLVTAREEERRRLRRDLHDGLGPALASITLKLDAARNLLTRDPPAAEALLVDLKKQTQGAVSDIRRLVYELRPPSLDELGLVSALHEQAQAYIGDGLTITFDAPEPLPALAAAVEVAAYRIVQEAMTNVVRHAQARTCTIRFALDQDLEMEICDDGRGISAGHRAGVGLTSIHERAAELGGTCQIESRPAGGTCLSVRLPLTKAAAREE